MTHPCPICGGAETPAFLTRRDVPVHQNRLYASAESARSARRGDLRMRVCADCGFVFNAAFDAGRLEYDSDYENDQTCSPAFSAYVDDRIRYLTDDAGLRGKTIVEVGCGKGYFIRRLVEADPGNHGLGFDASYTGPEVDCGGRLRFERRFYGRGSEHVAPDAVVCRHVIEHVAQPMELLEAVRDALEQAPQAQVFFETPAVEWILDNTVIWDFFYEHCSLFSERSIRTAFGAARFDVTVVRRAFAGQYLWIESRPASTANAPRDAGDLVARCRAFGEREETHLSEWRRRVEIARGEGPVAIWGAGAKGATFASLIDPEGSRIDCIVDVSPRKQRRFIAGSGHPIVSPEELRARGVRTAVVMNPNYESEIRQWLESQRLAVALLV